MLYNVENGLRGSTSKIELLVKRSLAVVWGRDNSGFEEVVAVRSKRGRFESYCRNRIDITS